MPKKPTQATISKIAREVKEALLKARAASDDEDMDKIIDQLEKTWDHCCERFIIMFVGLTAFKFRSDDQIRKSLLWYKTALENGQHQSLFADFDGKEC